MINCAFLMFKSCKHYIKGYIPLLSRWFGSLYSIHALKTKWTFVSIEMNIGVKSLKPVFIIGWWADTEYLMNGNTYILKCITDIQNPGSECMKIRDTDVGSGGVSMCHWTVGLIKSIP